MKVIKRMKYFLLFDKSTKRLLLEAFILLGWARVMKSQPFSKTALYLGEHMDETAYSDDNPNPRLVKQIAQSVNLMSRYTFWESMCLVKAIAAMKMLERRGIESTIYLGTTKDENGKMIAHAWLRSGPFYLTGADEMDRFVVVSKFAKRIKGVNHGN